METGPSCVIIPFDEALRLQSAWGVARAAVELVRAGGLVKGQDLVPVYHRLSQAERERLERERRGRENDEMQRG